MGNAETLLVNVSKLNSKFSLQNQHLIPKIISKFIIKSFDYSQENNIHDIGD